MPVYESQTRCNKGNVLNFNFRCNYAHFTISDPAEITWFERMYIWFRFIERNAMYPVVVLCALTQSVPQILCKFDK